MALVGPSSGTGTKPFQYQVGEHRSASLGTVLTIRHYPGTASSRDKGWEIWSMTHSLPPKRVVTRTSPPFSLLRIFFNRIFRYVRGAN